MEKNEKVNEIIQYFNDPQLISHYMKRIKNLQSDNDEFIQKIIAEEATFGITPIDFEVRMNK